MYRTSLTSDALPTPHRVQFLAYETEGVRSAREDAQAVKRHAFKLATASKKVDNVRSVFFTLLLYKIIKDHHSFISIPMVHCQNPKNLAVAKVLLETLYG